MRMCIRLEGNQPSYPCCFVTSCVLNRILPHLELNKCGRSSNVTPMTLRLTTTKRPDFMQ